jgi:hypothetical protein
VSRDLVRLVVVAASSDPPLEPDDGGLVVPADTVEQVETFDGMLDPRVKLPGVRRR